LPRSAITERACPPAPLSVVLPSGAALVQASQPPTISTSWSVCV